MKAGYYVMILLACMGCHSNAQNIQKIQAGDLPKGLHIPEEIKIAYKWADKDTIHYLVYTETGLYKTHPELKDSVPGRPNNYAEVNFEYNMTDAEYYFYHFTSYKNNTKIQWKIYDYVKECALDTRFNFVSDAFQITDLDKDGIHEIWVMYSQTCTIDVSPENLKLIMYEGTTKYTINGETRDYEENPQKQMDSPKNLSDNLEKGNPLFRKYALELWMTYNIYKHWSPE